MSDYDPYAGWQWLLGVIILAVAVVTTLIVLGIQAAWGAGPVVAEVEEDSLSALFTGLAGLLSGLGIWLTKTVYDKRSHPGGNLAAQALDSIKAHERLCEENRRQNRKEHEKLHERVSGLRNEMSGKLDTLTKEVAELNGNVQRLVGRQEGSSS